MPGALGYHLPTLRGVAEHLHLERVTQLARRPGMQAVYRITVHYFDGRASDSAATLYRTTADGVRFELRFQRALGGKPLSSPVSLDTYETFIKALQSIGFDHMDDQPNLPAYNMTDVWLIERGAGTFVHSVIVAPELASGAHARLVNAVRNGLPEALRMMT